MKVLVVLEDDVQMQRLINMNLQIDPRLELSGAASTAAEALQLAERIQPDLIVLDHFVQGDVMGLEAAPAFRQVAPEAKLLLFTSHDLWLEARREPAIDGFLSKTQITELLPTVQRMLDLEPFVPAGR